MEGLVRVTLGAMQFGEEHNLTPVVCLDCRRLEQAQALARFILKVQNGAHTMARQDEAFSTGDQRVKVEVLRYPSRPKEAVLATVRLRLSRGHLTEGVYAASAVEADAAQVFRFFEQVMRQFVLTVGVEGQPCCDLLYLVKYGLSWTSPVESSLP